MDDCERPPEHRTTGLWCWKKEPICVGRLSCRDSDHYHDIVVGRVIEYFLMSCFIILAGGLDISPIGRINQQYWNVSIFYFSLDSNPLFLAALATLYFSLVVSGGADSVNNSHIKTMTLIMNKKRVANCLQCILFNFGASFPFKTLEIEVELSIVSAF